MNESLLTLKDPQHPNWNFYNSIKMIITELIHKKKFSERNSQMNNTYPLFISALKNEQSLYSCRREFIEEFGEDPIDYYFAEAYSLANEARSMDHISISYSEDNLIAGIKIMNHPCKVPIPLSRVAAVSGILFINLTSQFNKDILPNLVGYDSDLIVTPISGYRTPQYNSQLKKKLGPNAIVAIHGQHTKCTAQDFALRKRDGSNFFSAGSKQIKKIVFKSFLKYVHDKMICNDIPIGGIGIYYKTNSVSVHVDFRGTAASWGQNVSDEETLELLRLHKAYRGGKTLNDFSGIIKNLSDSELNELISDPTTLKQYESKIQEI